MISTAFHWDEARNKGKRLTHNGGNIEDFKVREDNEEQKILPCR